MLAPILLAQAAFAQTPTSTPASTPKRSQSVHQPNTVAATSAWAELPAAQQQILSPLASSWGQFTTERKRKWIAVAKTYPSMTPQEQEKLQARMAQWAALKPSEREQARWNFAETQKLSPAARAAQWEAYQALSPEEREKLAAHEVHKPSGAAVALKPVAPGKLAIVPIKRHADANETDERERRPHVDRHTLLPQLAKPITVSSSPAQ